VELSIVCRLENRDPKLKKKKNSGVALFETLLCIQVMIVLLFWGHVQIVRLWKEKLKNLQTQRLPYDGVIIW
jgi:hypothetical protein